MQLFIQNLFAAAYVSPISTLTQSNKVQTKLTFFTIKLIFPQNPRIESSDLRSTPEPTTCAELFDWRLDDFSLSSES